MNWLKTLSYLVFALFVISCTSPEKKSRSIASNRSLVEMYERARTREIFFLGDEEQYRILLCVAEQEDVSILRLNMPGEIPNNTIDDNRDGFKDNVFGWDGIHARPFEPKRNAQTNASFHLYPFLTKNPIPLKPQGSISGVWGAVTTAHALLQNPTSVLIPDKESRRRFADEIERKPLFDSRNKRVQFIFLDLEFISQCGSLVGLK